MLNDSHRNECFREAVIKKIKQGFDTVLDVGTGTGILSLFGVEGGAKEIFACDSSPIMTDIAGEVFSYHNATKIKLIHKHSTQLEVNIDIPRKVSLLVTETVDSGVLGEGILSTLSDAWDRLLLPPPLNSFAHNDGTNGFVIPFATTIYIAGVHCDQIANSFYSKPTQLLNFIDLTSVNCENYDTIDLKRVDHRLLTNVYELSKINFNDPVLIKELMRGSHDKEHKLTCEVSGRLDCFAVWFELYVDEDIKLNTGPSSKDNEAWDQAIYLLPRVVFVEQNEEIPFQVSFKHGKLSVVSCDSPSAHSLSPSFEILKILNDNSMKKALTEVSERLSQFHKPLNVLDCFPFPFLGISFLTKRKNQFEDKVTCMARSEAEKTLLERVFVNCNISNRIEIIWEDDVEKLPETKQKFDVILVDLVETTGELNDKTVSLMETLRSILKPEGTLLPEEVTAIGQFIFSDWLNKVSRVGSEVNTCGYTINKFINKYQTTHQIDLHLKPEERIICSSSFDLFNLFSEEKVKQIKVDKFPTDVIPNAIIYWFKIKFLKGSTEFWTNNGNCVYGEGAFLFSEIGKDVFDFKVQIVRDGGLFVIKTT